ncbi:MULTISPECIES: carbohydrate-binding module family 20 domain-containing protein [Actinoalloteichus]|uniref:Alpha-amylase n=1 Tax=Actinoalloteichus fjordicus TaxID=1612552 RepID=A0AAC9LF03_9PSEU|nr:MULTISPECIES: carbohydrate-binding module family 20 domain-containing protein [Actinoalloteichus]APU15654.1 Starch binding domain-containing protein [Actinoalloteichus fjordicus]APU21714.1 Starch binding domain-containing protein [Actinoalloteichus sp. GBA129-24]
MRSRSRSTTRPRLGRLLAGLLAGVLATSTATGVLAAPEAEAAPPGDKDVTAVLFEQTFSSVARACTEVLGPKGYGYVQVSPPQERIQGPQWWTAYQPVSYRIAGPLGDRAAFQSMISTCNNAGVDVIVDAVVNHMSAGSGTGTGGTQYSKYNYPGHYQDQDFHGCRQPINNYNDRYNVQQCELVGLSDLNTGSEYVRSEIAEYLNDLISMGVDGFRVDAVKHMATDDLRAIKSRLSNPNVYWVQEAIFGAGEAVSPAEYLQNGDVQEFRYATGLKRVFTDESLAYLANYGEAWGFMPAGQSGVFIANHDTERNGSTMNYRDGAAYTLAHVFMLAHPYGTPSVHSGYDFSDHDAGAPGGGNVGACYSGGWRCQHAWPQIANMVGFRNAAGDAGITNWWDNGNDAIAFGRGDRAFVAINHEGSSITQTFQTSLPAGTYCDVQHGDPTSGGGCTGTTYTVDGGGRFTATIGAHDAVALHVGATGSPGPGPGPGPDPGRTGAAFSVTATTSWGENILVVGDHAGLGAWNPAAAVPLSSASYPTWTGDVSLPAGTVVQYKYLRKGANGSVTWESGANRSATVPASGVVRMTDAWRG